MQTIASHKFSFSCSFEYFVLNFYRLVPKHQLVSICLFLSRRAHVFYENSDLAYLHSKHINSLMMVSNCIGSRKGMLNKFTCIHVNLIEGVCGIRP